MKKFTAWVIVILLAASFVLFMVIKTIQTPALLLDWGAFAACCLWLWAVNNI